MDEDEVRIVFLGKTGSGKSSFMNTFLGEDKFEVSCSPKSQTQICQREEKVINGRKYVVIDTPGVFDTDRPEKDVRAEIISSLVECAPGPHVFILVLKVEKYTRKEQEIVNKIIGYFGEKTFNHLVMLFTHGDNLDKNMTIQDFINKPCNIAYSLSLEKVSSKCGDRVHVIDNKYWNKTLLDDLANLNIPQGTLREIYNKLQTDDSDYRNNKNQINQLLSSIDKILKGNDSRFYTNPCLEELGRQIKEEERNILKEMKSGDQSVDKGEIKRRARERVRTKTQRILAGVATGFLLGAFLGLGVGSLAPVVFVAGLLKAGWRKITGQRPPETEKTVKKTEGAAAAAAGGAVTAGVVTEIATIGTEAAMLGAGAATGIGVAVAAGILLLHGAVKGTKSGIDASKVSDNPNQAAKNVTDTVTENAKDFLKACWNVGSKGSRDLGSNNNDGKEKLIKAFN